MLLLRSRGGLVASTDKSFLRESRGELTSANNLINSKKLESAFSDRPASTDMKLESRPILRTSGLEAVAEA